MTCDVMVSGRPCVLSEGHAGFHWAGPEDPPEQAVYGERPLPGRIEDVEELHRHVRVLAWQLIVDGVRLST